MEEQKQLGKLDKFFKLSERGTTVKVELMAGLTTFFAMVYILLVNAGMLSMSIVGDPQATYNAIYIATAISAVAGTILIGLLANLPLAQASGMGLNAFFVFTVCFQFGFSYANALVMVLFDGLIFIALTATGLRKKIFTAIPDVVKTAISTGIGLFIAFIGLQSSGIVIPDASTGVTLASFNLLTDGNWKNIMPLLVCFATFIAIAIMAHKNIKGAVLFGILGGTVLYYLLGLTTGMYPMDISVTNPITAFKDFGNLSFGKVFTEGFDFSAYINAHGTANFILILATTALAFCMVDMFDTLGTLYASCEKGNLLDEEGNIPNMNKAMLADAIATSVGAVCGTSTVTTFVESSAGVAEGGRTGLTSVFVAALFLLATFLSPIAQLIPGCTTNAALIWVGVLMMSSITKINWSSIEDAVPAFLTIAMMPFTYNISYGIAFGLFSYILIRLCTGKAKEIKIGTIVIAVLFVAMLFLTH